MSADAADSATAPGAVIAGHRIVGTIERWDGGAVFRAEAPDGTPVVLRAEKLSGGRAALGRFQTRAKGLEELSHPALARVTGFGESGEGIWMATAAVEGTPLRGLIDLGISPMRAVRLLGEVADGIDAAHRAGLAHGDVRAENVIVRGRPVEHAVLTGFPVSTDGTEPSDDVGALDTLLRECVPDAPAGRTEGVTAGALVATAAQTLLHHRPAEPSRENGAEVLEPAPTPRRRSLRPGPRLRGVLKVAAAVLVVAAAAAGGYAVSERSKSDEPAPSGTAAAGALTITVPPGWETAGSGRTLRPLEEGVVLTRESPAGTISAGTAKDRSAVLDPSALVKDIAGRAPRPREVRTGELPVLRFDGLRGEGLSVMYVASTSEGAPAIACSGSDVGEACAQAAAGLALRGARAYDPAAGIEWKNRLARDMRRLRARRGRGLRRLRAAKTPDAQAGAANGIGRAHASAARAIRRRDAPPQAARARRRVLAHLLDADRAYRSLARAAEADDEQAFERAQGRVRRADRRLQVTLRSL